MPEGPSIILDKEAAAEFAGKKIIAVSGNSKIDHNILLNKKISLKVGESIFSFA